MQENKNTVQEEKQQGLPSGVTIDHSGYSVPNIEQAIAFFTQVLGFEVLKVFGPMEAPPNDMMTRLYNIDPRSSVRGAAFLLYGGKQIELVQWASPDQQSIILKNSDIGATHLALSVRDLPAAMAYLKEQPGVQVREPAPMGFAYFTTPWGLEMQLIAVS
jgi:catechol 2,3-dioxygenase-like lactoylglutathione lyase family enzyme